MKTLKVGLMLVALTALLIWIGNMIGGSTGVVLALAFSVAMNIGTFWFSDKIVLKMVRAQPITREDVPGLYNMVERLSFRAGIPMPALYIVPDESPNAFATGRSPQHAAVAVNEGLLRLLGTSEVEGVIAHELAHIKNRDTLTMAIVATIAGAVSSLAYILHWIPFFGSEDDGINPMAAIAMAIFAPMAAMMIQMGVSRAREYEADALGAQIAGSPYGLANALIKLEQGASAIPSNMPATAAHMCIVNPLSGVGGAMLSLFSTHPPIAERVKRLQAMRTQPTYDAA